MMSTHRLREYTLIGAMMVLGVILGTVYVQAAGGQATLTLSDGEPKSAEDRMALENEAIEIALSDPRVKPLTEGKTVRIFSTFYMTFHVEFIEKVPWGSAWRETFQYVWDGKYRALVTLRYPDDTGYGVDVNITDRVVGEPQRAVWEEGKYYKLLP
jgi:hypothetical protein